MNMPVGWLKQHQVVAFLIPAYGITWPLFILIFFVVPGNDLVKILTGGPLAVFSPALAAMLIPAIVEPQPKPGTDKRR